MDIHSFKPYQRFLTGTLFLTFLIVGVLGSTTVYFYNTRNLFRETQETLRQVAVNAAGNIPVGEHEKIVNADDDKTMAYAEIVERFHAMMDGNPRIDDIYTLRPTSEQGIFTFVVAGQETADTNGDGTVDQSEVRPAVGETYDAKDFPRLVEGLSAPSSDDEVTVDKWGSWVSGYAPVKDATGKVVAVLGVDYSAAVLDSQRWELIKSLLLVDLMLLPFLLLIAYVVARYLARPYQVLARAMYDVAHGEAHKQLEVRGRKSTRVFFELFNGMVNMIGAAKHSKDDEK